MDLVPRFLVQWRIQSNYNPISQRRTSLFSNTLVLPNFNALEAAKIDDSKLGPFESSFTRKNGHFEGAIFEGADLRKINLENAHLQGASLLYAKLQGAQFYNANLNGADLYQAKLQGASLDNAHLEGVRLEGAELQGAWVLDADLKGASLSGAQLQGARLNSAQLQGAELNGANLQGASLDGVFLWRAWLSVKSIDAIRAQGLMWEQSWKEPTQSTDSKPWTKEAFLALKNTVERDVPAGDTRAETLKRMEILDPGGTFAGGANVPEWRKKIEIRGIQKGALRRIEGACLLRRRRRSLCRARPRYVRRDQGHGRGGCRSRRCDPQLGLPRFRRLDGTRQSGAEKAGQRGATQQKQAIIHRRGKSGWREPDGVL